MQINENLKKIREELGMLPSDELYEFAEAVIERLFKEFALKGKPLNLSQVAIAREFFYKEE